MRVKALALATLALFGCTSVPMLGPVPLIPLPSASHSWQGVEFRDAILMTEEELRWELHQRIVKQSTTLDNINQLLPAFDEVKRDHHKSNGRRFRATYILFYTTDLYGGIYLFPTGVRYTRGVVDVDSLMLTFDRLGCRCLLEFEEAGISAEPYGSLGIDLNEAKQDLANLGIITGLRDIADAIDNAGDDITNEIGAEGDDISDSISELPRGFGDEARGLRARGTVTINNGSVTATGQFD